MYDTAALIERLGDILEALERIPRRFAGIASAEAFEQEVRDYSQNLRLGDTSTMLEVVSARLSGEWAAVTVRETSFYQGGLFDSRQNVNTFEMQLRRDSQSGAWRIIKSGSYWASCWNDKTICR